MTPYEVLGVAEDADRETIDRTYRRLAFQHHPDRNPGDEDAARRFDAATQAHAALTNRLSVVDPVESYALAILARTTALVLSSIIQGGGEPKRRDVIDGIKAKLKTDLADNREKKRQLKIGLEKIEGCTGRFTGQSASLFEGFVANAVADATRQLERTEAEIKASELAVEIIADAGFKVDRPVGAVGLSMGGKVSWSKGFMDGFDW